MRLFVGTRKGLFIYAHGSAGWAIEKRGFLGDPVAALLPDRRDGKLYAALALGHFGSKLHRSDDNGDSWQEVTTPSYPTKPAEHPDLTPWSVEQIWSLEAGGDDQPGRIWCATIPGGLFRSDDAGMSWSLNQALWEEPKRGLWQGGGYDWPGIHSIMVDPRNSRHITVGISIGGVWQSQDDGATWQPKGKGLRADYVPPDIAGDPEQQDPHRIVHCASAPDTLWMQHHNGQWVSHDNGNTWDELLEVTPSNFGFAVAADPHDPMRAWFVPGGKDEHRIPVDGALVVNRTDDGGRSFTSLTEGLPQQDAYDLIYRHCLDVSPEVNTLAMGSTTGNLWTSANGGDSFVRLSANLPPIYCVRFG